RVHRRGSAAWPRAPPRLLQRHPAARTRPACDTRAQPVRRVRRALRGGGESLPRGGDARGRRRARRRRPDLPRSRLGRARACLRAGLRRHRRRDARAVARHPAPAGAPPPGGYLRRPGHGRLRQSDARRRRRLPARPIPGHRWPSRPPDAHPALRHRRRLPATHTRLLRRRDVMSSILDALEKVENAERWTPQAGPARPEGRSKLRLAAIAAGVAFAAGAGVAALVLRPGPQRTAAPEAPRPPVEGAAANPAAPTQAPRQPAVAAVEPRREPIDEGRSAPRLPTVRLSFLVYSPSAERRSVVLATEGGSLTTLHEGERVGDIEVARILPDSVELRYEGRVFTVSPRD